MAFVQPWILLFGFTLIQCAGFVYSWRSVPPDEDQTTIHLYLEEVLPRPPVKYYPFTPEEKERLYWKLWKQYKKVPKYEKYSSFSKLKYHLNHMGYDCCGGGWIGIGSVNEYKPYEYEYQKHNKPVLQLDYNYPSNQVQEYGNSQVKPVVEHIEGDLKYDFRTKTHSY